jgi:hypothetical protein
MNKRNIRTATDEELLRQFEEDAQIHGALRTAKEANRAFDESVAIWRELKHRGKVAIDLFLQLLNSPRPEVRLLCASNALFIVPELAEPILERLVSEPKFIGISA